MHNTSARYSQCPSKSIQLQRVLLHQFVKQTELNTFHCPIHTGAIEQHKQEI